MAFLGHIVSGEGIYVDTQNIEAIQICPRLTSLTNIRSFLACLHIIGDALKDSHLSLLL